MAPAPQDFLHTLVDPKDAAIDIVAVHGLNPTNVEFHATRTWTAENGKFWLKDAEFLPKSIPNARIMCFGYNANVAFHSSIAGVNQQADNLLIWLDLKRKADPERPLIFICHSLGGIVVKQALTYARLDSTFERICRRTYGIAFFGTPHRGGNLAKLGDIAAKVARLTLRNPDNTFMDALRKDSLFSAEKFDAFQKHLDKYDVVSFYETLPFNRALGLIVDRKSATFGLPGSRERQIGLERNHSDMCKFAHPEIDAWELVSASISSTAKNAIKAGERSTDQHSPMPATQTPVQSAPSSTPTVHNAHWFVHQHETSFFTGREKIGERLEDALLSRQFDGQRRYVIAGLGGTGKSAVCLRFALRHRQRFWGVFWINCAEEDIAETSLTRCAKDCGQPVRDLNDALRWLASVEQPWLLLLDNADSADVDYSKYFPPCSSGAILLTTRNEGCFTHATVGFEKLDPLKPAEASELLRKAAQIDQSAWPDRQHAAERVIQSLGSHTLAIISAGAVVRNCFCSLEEYPSLLNQQPAWFLKYSEVQAGSTYQTVYKTFEASAAMLQSSEINGAAESLQILGIMAFMHSERIPRSALEAVYSGVKLIREQDQENAEKNLRALPTRLIDELPDFLHQNSSANANLFSIRQACSLLSSMSLINTINEEENVLISMHPLVHAWARERLSLSEQGSSWLAASMILALSIPPDEEYNSQFRILNSHALALESRRTSCSQNISRSDLYKILFRFGWLSYRNADYLQALSLFSEISDCVTYGGVTTDDHRHSLLLYMVHCKIRLEKNLGLIQELEELIAMQKKTLHCNDTRYLDSNHALALVYITEGWYGRAVRLLELMVDIEDKAGEATRNVGFCPKTTLASSYIHNGQYGKVVSLLENLVKKQEVSLAARDSNRVEQAFYLGLAYTYTGQHHEAIELLEKVVNITKTALHATHIYHLECQRALAVSYKHHGQLEKAVSLLEDVVDTVKTILTYTDPLHLSSQHSLALAYRDNGQLEKAVSLLERVVEIEKTTLDATHPSRIISQHELAWSYYLSKQYPPALQLMTEVVEMEATLEEGPSGDYHAQQSLRIIQEAMSQEARSGDADMEQESNAETQEARSEGTDVEQEGDAKTHGTAPPPPTNPAVTLPLRDPRPRAPGTRTSRGLLKFLFHGGKKPTAR